MHHHKHGKVIFCRSLLETTPSVVIILIDVIAKKTGYENHHHCKSTYCIYICKHNYSEKIADLFCLQLSKMRLKKQCVGRRKYVITTVEGRCGNFRCTSRVLMASYVTRHSWRRSRCQKRSQWTFTSGWSFW